MRRAMHYMDVWNCIDCGLDTHLHAEYYMIHNHLWRKVAGNSQAGMMCIGCVERRLQRHLTHRDFTPAPINWDDRRRSYRLTSRLRR